MIVCEVLEWNRTAQTVRVQPVVLRENGGPVPVGVLVSPDGRRAFFNSDETGILQAYMIEGLEDLAAD